MPVQSDGLGQEGLLPIGSSASTLHVAMLDVPSMFISNCADGVRAWQHHLPIPGEAKTEIESVATAKKEFADDPSRLADLNRVAEPWPAPVLVRQQLRAPWRQRPFHPDFWVVKSDAAIVSGRIDCGRLVEDFSVRLQRDEPMRKANRHKQLAPVLG